MECLGKRESANWLTLDYPSLLKTTLPLTHTNSSALGYACYGQPPEVLTGQRYDLKADIYSLGMIALQIFDTSINNLDEGNYLEKFFSATIGQKIDIWDRLISDKMVIASRRQRMTCEDILSQIKKLGINRKYIIVNELEFYKNKFKENHLKYFSDIINLSMSR